MFAVEGGRDPSTDSERANSNHPCGPFSAAAILISMFPCFRMANIWKDGKRLEVGMTKLFLTGLVLCLLLAAGGCAVVPLHGSPVVHYYEQPVDCIAYGYYSHPVLVHNSRISYGLSPITWSYGYSHPAIRTIPDCKTICAILPLPVSKQRFAPDDDGFDRFRVRGFNAGIEGAYVFGGLSIRCRGIQAVFVRKATSFGTPEVPEVLSRKAKQPKGGEYVGPQRHPRTWRYQCRPRHRAGS